MPDTVRSSSTSRQSAGPCDILPSQPKGPYGKNLITEEKVEIREGSDGKEHTYVTFDRLICNFQHNDHYHVFIEQKLEENGKKKTYYTNEFSCTEKYLDFKYVPTGTEQMQAEKDDHSNFFVKRQAVLLDDRPPRSIVKGRLGREIGRASCRERV